MALFNRIFSTGGRNKTQTKHPEHVSEKLFAFSGEQVRVVLFRECDFRGRKLLFDSASIRKVPVGHAHHQRQQQRQKGGAGPEPANAEGEKFSEVCDGFGYVYKKPLPDIGDLSEMVFGSVAMSFRGTYFKMHSLDSPGRLMFTQVFPSPKASHSNNSSSQGSPRGGGAAANNNNHFIEHSSKSNDSGTSSTNSFISEQLSFINSNNNNNSPSSDAVLVCRRLHSTPLDVPAAATPLSGTAGLMVGDSGYSAEHSVGGDSATTTPADSTWNSLLEDSGSSTVSFSSSSLYKKWLRRNSTSLNNNNNNNGNSCYSLPGSFPELPGGGRHHRTNKLGLAMIVELTSGQEGPLTQFLMEHILLLEAMLWRARRVIELAISVRSHNFASLMVEMVQLSTQYLVTLLSGAYISSNLWLSLSSPSSSYSSSSLNSSNSNLGCDNNNKSDRVISDCDGKSEVIMVRERLLRSASSGGLLVNNNNSDRPDLTGSCKTYKQFTNNSNSNNSSGAEFGVFSFRKFLKLDYSAAREGGGVLRGGGEPAAAQKFVQDFCELLEAVDVKNTNFFMSTLLTAVLTHHLGWVNTCFPQQQQQQTSQHSSGPKPPFNPLWGELSDLYGAVGHPTKMAQTIITGTNRKDVVSRILASLTYFIRCCDHDRRVPIRADVETDDAAVEAICHEHSCIPKESYKKYEDHLREIMVVSPSSSSSSSSPSANGFDLEAKNQSGENVLGRKSNTVGTLSLSKTRTCLGNLSEMETFGGGEDVVAGNSCGNLEKGSYFDSAEISRKVNRLIRVPTSATLCYTSSASSTSNETLILGRKVTMERQTKSAEDPGVVFVLGDDEKLVGLRKDPKNYPMEADKAKIEGGEKIPRPTFLDLSKTLHECTASENPTTNQKAPTFADLSKALRETSAVPNSSDDDVCTTTSIFKDSDFVLKQSNIVLQPSTSWSSLLLPAPSDQSEKSPPKPQTNIEANPIPNIATTKYSRSQSVPPEDLSSSSSSNTPPTKKSSSKYKYSGVKFNLQQYPQILSNYMKSKNLEMTNLQFSDKGLKLDQISTLEDSVDPRYSQENALDEGEEEEETLQTPSNASELEFTSDLFVAPPPVPQRAKEGAVTSSIPPKLPTAFVKLSLPNTVIREAVVEREEEECGNEKEDGTFSSSSRPQMMKVANLPMPRTVFSKPIAEAVKYTSSLMRAASDTYMPDMVLQGSTLPKTQWESNLKSDLVLASQHSLIDQPVDEAVAVIANTDTWEVQLMSSHTFVIDKGSSGIRVGMSQLVANMLESLLQMWKLNVPAVYCLMHVEHALQELFVQSKALAELLLATEFCSMEQLTSTLQLEVNDVPLLLAVASTHTPQVTHKYGLSFQ